MKAFLGEQRTCIQTTRDALQHLITWDQQMPALKPKSKLAHTLILGAGGAAPTFNDQATALVRLFNHLEALKAKKVVVITTE